MKFIKLLLILPPALVTLYLMYIIYEYEKSKKYYGTKVRL